jgi:hypothetical protein
MDLDFWTGNSTGHRDDPDDPDLITIAWAVKPGVVIEEATVLEGTMLTLRVRVPAAVHTQLTQNEEQD